VNSVDPAKPRTWVPYNENNCIGCKSGCCTLPVEVDIEDLILMDLVSREEYLESPKKVAQALIKKKIVTELRAKTGLFVLQQRENMDCVFLDKQRLCKIYDKRPKVCRNFPKVSARPNFCPYQSK
jgi:Fe-S-cluster containining protein